MVLFWKEVLLSRLGTFSKAALDQTCNQKYGEHMRRRKPVYLVFLSQVVAKVQAPDLLFSITIPALYIPALYVKSGWYKRELDRTYNKNRNLTVLI